MAELKDRAGAVSGKQVLQISLDRLEPNPAQPRKDFNEAKHRELVAGIKAVGLLMPITIAPRDDGKDGFFIVAGERRWRAFKELRDSAKDPAERAKWEKIDAIENREGALKDRRAVQALVENTHRANLSPMEVGEALRVIQIGGDADNPQPAISTEELAQISGFHVDYVRKVLALANAPAPIREAAARGIRIPVLDDAGNPIPLDGDAKPAAADGDGATTIDDTKPVRFRTKLAPIREHEILQELVALANYYEKNKPKKAEALIRKATETVARGVNEDAWTKRRVVAYRKAIMEGKSEDAAKSATRPEATGSMFADDLRKLFRKYETAGVAPESLRAAMAAIAAETAKTPPSTATAAQESVTSAKRA